VSKRLLAVIVVIAALSDAWSLLAQSKSSKPAAEQRAFYEDCMGGDKNRPCVFDHSVPLPKNVLDILRASKEARESRDALKDYDRDGFSQLFKAAVIHLGGPEETDYVVMGEFPMGGADAPWFWIVRSDQSLPKVIFFTFANGFEILKSISNGYPNIRSIAWTGCCRFTNLYQYNGQRYVLVHAYHRQNMPQP